MGDQYAALRAALAEIDDNNAAQGTVFMLARACDPDTIRALLADADALAACRDREGNLHSDWDDEVTKRQCAERALARERERDERIVDALNAIVRSRGAR